MALSELAERRIHVLPKELLERVRRYQQENNIASEVEAVRRLLNEALQNRDNVEDILNQLFSAFENEKDLRILARDILSTHVKIKQVQWGDDFIKFEHANGKAGVITKKGELFHSDSFDNNGYENMVKYFTSKKDNTYSKRFSKFYD